jgi:hypothetical protein
MVRGELCSLGDAEMVSLENRLNRTLMNVIRECQSKIAAEYQLSLQSPVDVDSDQEPMDDETSDPIVSSNYEIRPEQQTYSSFDDSDTLAGSFRNSVNTDVQLPPSPNLSPFKGIAVIDGVGLVQNEAGFELPRELGAPDLTSSTSYPIATGDTLASNGFYFETEQKKMNGFNAEAFNASNYTNWTS